MMKMILNESVGKQKLAIYQLDGQVFIEHCDQFNYETHTECSEELSEKIIKALMEAHPSLKEKMLKSYHL